MNTYKIKFEMLQKYLETEMKDLLTELEKDSEIFKYISKHDFIHKYWDRSFGAVCFYGQITNDYEHTKVTQVWTEYNEKYFKLSNEYKRKGV